MNPYVTTFAPIQLVLPALRSFASDTSRITTRNGAVQDHISVCVERDHVSHRRRPFTSRIFERFWKLLQEACVRSRLIRYTELHSECWWMSICLLLGFTFFDLFVQFAYHFMNIQKWNVVQGRHRRREMDMKENTTRKQKMLEKKKGPMRQQVTFRHCDFTNEISESRSSTLSRRTKGRRRCSV